MKKERTLSERKSRAGFLFCLPLVIGVVIFFIKPVIESIRYSFSVLSFTPDGLEVVFVGLRNFREALFVDSQYVRTIAESVKNMVIRVPVILMLSLFIAVVLNVKFKGRLVFRAIFFMPVIVVNGVIMEILQSDYLSTSIMSGEAGSALFESIDSYALLSAMGFSNEILDTIIPWAYDIFNLVWSSGVPILMFLAALQTVPSSLYEVARIEGATPWESFWKITFPIISPMILMNTVYILADYFTTSTNPVIEMINNQTSNMRFEYAAGLSWMYLIVVGIIVSIAFYFINKHVVYSVN